MSIPQKETITYPTTDHVYITVNVEREIVTLDFRNDGNEIVTTVAMYSETAKKMAADITGFFTKLDELKKFAHTQNITVLDTVIIDR